MNRTRKRIRLWAATIILIVVIMSCMLTSCGTEKDDMTIRKAIVRMPDGSVQVFEVDYWVTGYSQVAIHLKDGTIYTVAYENCILIKNSK